MNSTSQNRHHHTTPLHEDRRHDLDALRAFAMLLGVLFHLGLSVGTKFWVVTDRKQSDLFRHLSDLTHGFRMQLFFLLSGFFTMLLFRKRGLKTLLKQRSLRILVPCLLGAWTIVPLDTWTVKWAGRHSAATSTPDEAPLVHAIRQHDETKVTELAATEEIYRLDPQMGLSPFTWCVIENEPMLLKLILNGKIGPDRGQRDGSTALHWAALLGNAECAEILLQAGARPTATDLLGKSVSDRLSVDLNQARESLKGYAQIDSVQVEEGRRSVSELLEAAQAKPVVPSQALAASMPGWLVKYSEWLSSDSWIINWRGKPLHLIDDGTFDHLWFLWMLVWCTIGFALLASTGTRLGWSRPAWLPILSWRMLLWVTPLVAAMQTCMRIPILGADTWNGIIPPPHLITYYGLFFAFGAFYYDAHDTEGWLGRRWQLLLGFALFVAYPAARWSLGNRWLNVPAQVAFTLTMCFGLIGLARRLLHQPRPWIRYLADSSYWVFIIHLPVVFWVQEMVRPWDWNVFVKFAFMTVLTMTICLITYHFLVRSTWLGWLLNGRMVRHGGSAPGHRQPSHQGVYAPTRLPDSVTGGSKLS